MGLRDKYRVSMDVYSLTIDHNKADYETNIGSEYVHLQPMDAAYAALIGGNLSKSFVIFTKLDTIIKPGMRLRSSTGELANTYFVKEEKTFEIGSKYNQHKKFIIEQKDV